MSRIVFVNGEFVAEEQAKISIFDRGFLFADAVYEVISVINGQLIDSDGHIKRLQRSLNELQFTAEIDYSQILANCVEIAKKNTLHEGLIYMQVSRGAENRSFNWSEDLTPSVVMFTQNLNVINPAILQRGLKVMTVEDIRWKRRDIKTTMLLAQSLHKQQAVKSGFDDAWMIEDGVITEGSSNNAYIITHDNKLITRKADHRILNGITRQAVMRLTEKTDLELIETPFSLDQAIAAKEAFITSATALVMPVVEIDGHKIGDGKPGELTLKLRQHYLDVVLSS